MQRWFRFALVGLTLFGCTVAAMAAKDKKKDDEKKETKWEEKTFKGLKMRSIGPALMAGRIADIAIHPQNRSVWYVGVGSGGVWKTVNAGTTWTPIFDDQASYSIGCITIDPNQPEVIWVGSGENVGGRHVGYGDGVYRSLDGGKSWENMGLKGSEHIGTIVVDPRDSSTVYVAAQGPLWSGGGDRGLYKTTDGGKNWEKILGEGEYTGVNEVVMDPRNADVLYASTHQRIRTVAALVNGGPGSGIHKSTDGGKTWRQLTSGLPAEDKGKIGLTISPQRPDVVYATVELGQRKGGFYRSTDGGATWEKRSDYVSGGTGPHYYMEIFASPHQFDRIYHMDVRLHVSEDGGKNFKQVGEKHKHVDNHAIAFDPGNPNYLLVGCDGGLYESWDLGKNWKFFGNMPLTQFYKVAVDYDEPFYNVYGGTQDNNTQGGPSRTDNISGIRNSDWFITLFGDGHQPAVDPTNPDIVYSEWQQGNLMRYDRKTGELVYIQPQPAEGDAPERWNWDSPILISAHDPARLYFASQRVWRSDDRGDSWRPVSGDLSRGENRLRMPMMGRQWSSDAVWDLWAMSNYANVTSLGESPKNPDLLYAGTDDGLVQVSEDGGANWRQIDVGSFPGVPKMSFVNDIKADLHDENTVYVALDNHKNGDFKPYLVKSTDRGRTWKSMVGNLPDRHLIWRLVQDHVKPELLFAGTEFGVFFTVNGGESWIKLGGGVPNIPFRDLAIQKRENDLVGATFGRSFYILDDYTPLRDVSDAVLEAEATLFPVKDTWWYIPKRPLGNDAKASQGGDFFTAENPPFGAVFTYYLSEGYKSRKAVRQKAEKKAAKDKKGSAYPDWDDLKKEELEHKPQIVFTVKDAQGQVINQVTGKASPGFHRVAWNLRYPTTQAWQEREAGGFFGNNGWLATPGNYTVSMAKRVDGVTTPLGEPRSFEVKVLPGYSPTLSQMTTAQVHRAHQEIGSMQGAISSAVAVVAETEKRLGAIKKVLQRGMGEHPEMWSNLVALEARMYDLRDRLQGDRLKNRIGEPSTPSVTGRIGSVVIGNLFSTYGPTPNLMKSFEIAKKQLATVRSELNTLINRDLTELERRMDAAGLPWTPGRAIVPAP